MHGAELQNLLKLFEWIVEGSSSVTGIALPRADSETSKIVH
jgi:hypothetical protein